MENRTKRTQKTTREQYELYLLELEENQHFRENKFDATNPDVLKTSWDKLVEKLNASGGPVRNVVGWKRVFSDWKSQARAKARRIKYCNNATGNNMDTPKSLQDIEEKLLNITGRVVIEGFPLTPEIGIEQLPGCSENKENEIHIEGESSTSLNVEPPKKKKRGSLVSYVENILSDNSSNNNGLNDIVREIKVSNKILQKQLKLKKLELQVKYPGYNFIVSSSDSE